MTESTTVTMGWDVGDKFTDVCVLGADGAILEQQQVRTTKHSLEKQLSQHPGARVVLEVGVHSRWISDLVRGRGHEVIVANARQVQLIYRRKSKTDRSDAVVRARLGRFDPTLLAPVHHRSRNKKPGFRRPDRGAAWAVCSRTCCASVQDLVRIVRVAERPERGIHVTRVPEDDRVEHQAERAELRTTATGSRVVPEQTSHF